MKFRKKSVLQLLLLSVFIAVVFFGGSVGYWLFVALLLCVAARLFLSLLCPSDGVGAASQERLIKNLARVSGLFFISGTLIFLSAFSAIGAGAQEVLFSNTELVVRSMICSLDMFMLDVDGSIFERLDSRPMLKAMISVQCALSFSCTIVLLLSLVFSRVKAYYRLHAQTRLSADKNHMYLFFGVNEPGRLLASDIRRKDSKALIVFVEQANVNEDDSDSLGSIVSLFTHRRRTFRLADESDALVAIASCQFKDLPMSDCCAEGEDVFAAAGLAKIQQLVMQLLQFREGAELHAFFMSDDEDANIMNLTALANDAGILAVAKLNDVTCRIYCHARRNGPNRVVEDIEVSKRLDVVLVDSSHLAVELLKSSRDVQPVMAAALSHNVPAAVCSPIEALVIGFGEVGRDAFRFLYEFGVFVGEQSDKVRTVAMLPRITAVDAAMDSIKGRFVAQLPGVRFDDGRISLKQMDCNSTEFLCDMLTPEKCRSLNYIVIALGDDDSNISLASALFERIRRHRVDMSRLIIMVRCLSDEKMGMMRRIAAHYNFGQATGRDNVPVIRLFGAPSEIYTYDMVVGREFQHQGQRFLESYRLRHGGDDWHARRSKLTAADSSAKPRLDNLRRLRRQEGQDMANALHAITKVELLKRTSGPAFNPHDFRSRFFSSDGSSTMAGGGVDICYPKLNETENRMILNLAMLEHLRWSASHELLGYIANDSGCSTDERTMRHNCLRPWHELDAESQAMSSHDWKCDYKSYDFAVVETSIDINLK